MRKIVRTLAIETSCDDTSLALVAYDGGNFHVEKILAYSQLEEHKKYGGVVPELAARSHLEKILPLVEELGGVALCEEIDCISVTAYPGLPGALVVGVTVAHTLGALWQKPVVEVNHIMGHVFSILADRSLESLQVPYLCLTVSGGHNDIYLVENSHEATIVPTSGENKGAEEDGLWHKRKHIPLGGSLSVGPYRITKCAQTMDDAAGEVFDKSARMLGGPYPGGKWVDNQASSSRGNSPYTFKKPIMPDDQFSLSGIKSQVHNMLQKIPMEERTDSLVQDICFSFRECVVDVLVDKFELFVDLMQPSGLGVVGGVSANTRLREKMEEHFGGKVVYPEKFMYCTDNAGMIGVVGLIQYLHESN